MSDDTTAGPGVDSKPRRGGDQGSATNRLNAAERSKQALKLRLMRHSYDTIAKQLGYSNKSAARKAVMREIEKVPREAAKELRSQELETLDMAQRALMPSVLAGHLGAMDRLVKLMEQRAKLTGIHENVVDTGVDEFKSVLAAWAQQIAQQVDEDESRESHGVTDDDDQSRDDAPTIEP